MCPETFHGQTTLDTTLSSFQFEYPKCKTAWTSIQKSTEQIPLISRGQSVKVQVAQGAVRLSVEGIALSDGTQGQIISIQNPASNRVFEAKITGKATVEALP